MVELTEQARQARLDYYRAYREANRERIRKQQYEWAKRNKEKMLQSQAKYWESKASE